MGFTLMTSVQKLSMPVVLEGRDVLIQSQTGSGKHMIQFSLFCISIITDVYVVISLALSVGATQLVRQQK